ncbi:MAG TPA: DMT family transporter [Thermoanaerobaculia bacterium]|nr:DMT family transporter [Thermoanaerobaculia bacterium]
MIHGLTSAALLLILSSALAWAGFDLLRKLLAREISPLALLALNCTASTPLFALWAALDGGFHASPGYWAPALASVALNVASNLLYLEALRTADLSLTVPLLSLTPAFAALLAIPLLGERPSLGDGAGIALVVIGAFALRAPAAGQASRLRGLLGQRGLWLMAGTAFLWSLATPLDKLAVGRSTPPVHATVLNAGVALSTLLALALRRELYELRQVARRPGLFVLSQAVAAIALGAQLAALATVWVSVVETCKRAIGNLCAVVVGRIAFGEPLTPRKLAAVVVMAAGVALILL